jgi:DNA-binding winged helix-turn-helix (wHTH) protein
MAPPAWSTDTSNPTPGPAGYQVDDLTIELAPRRVIRAGTVIPLKALSFDLLVTLTRVAPNLLSLDQLSERVWPGLVVTPETIVQRVKLLRSALGDDASAPRYIEGVRGRGYRMLAEVRALSAKDSRSEQAGVATAAAAAVSSPLRE